MKKLKLNDLVQVMFDSKEVTGVITEFDGNRPGVKVCFGVVKFFEPEEILKVW